MKIIIYGDSFGFGGGLNIEYAINKGYIDQYDHNKFFNLNKELQEESMNYAINNRWSSLLEKELNIKIKNNSVSGAGWQFLKYYFLKNDFFNKEETFYIFCPPRSEFKRLLMDVNFDNSLNDLFLMKHLDYNCVIFENNHKKINKKNTNTKNTLLNKLFTKQVVDQLNFQSILGILNYLIIHNKKFIFLPSWSNSVKSSFIFDDYEKNDTFNMFNFFIKNNNKIKKENDIFYHKYIFKYIDDIKISNFWCENDDNKLLSGHPNVSSQEKIKNNYIKIINDYNLV